MDNKVTRVDRHNRRLRASCDQCTDSKLKCDQGKPECRRCANRGRSCVYSLIRAVGRPKASTGANNPRRTQSGVSATDPSRPVRDHGDDREDRHLDPARDDSQAGGTATHRCSCDHLDMINGIIRTTSEETLRTASPSPQATSGTSESSSCHSALATPTLALSDATFNFNKPFESLEDFPFDDVSFNAPSIGDVDYDVFMSSSVLMNSLEQQRLPGQPPVHHVTLEDLVDPKTNQLKADAGDGIYGSGISSESANDPVDTATRLPSVSLISPSVAPNATTKQNSTNPGLVNQLFTTQHFSDISPMKTQQIMVQHLEGTRLRTRMLPNREDDQDFGSCRCPALVGTLQVLVSTLATDDRESEGIHLDVLLRLDDELWSTQQAVTACRRCAHLPSSLQEVTICMVTNWVTDSWKRFIQEKILKKKPIGPLRKFNEAQQHLNLPAKEDSSVIRLGSTQIDDAAWSLCVRDLLKMRLFRLNRLVHHLPSDSVHRNGNDSKTSAWKAGVDALKQETTSKVEMVLGMLDSCRL